MRKLRFNLLASRNQQIYHQRKNWNNAMGTLEKILFYGCFRINFGEKIENISPRNQSLIIYCMEDKYSPSA